jgi:hypothetical protein
MWYQITLAIGERAKAVAQAQGCSYLDNPPLPLDTAQIEQERALFVLQRGDRVLDQPGQEREKRRCRVLLGAVALTKRSLADADTLLFAGRVALRSAAFRAALRAAGDVAAVREVELEPEAKSPATEGTVLMTAFEVDYFQTYPAA